MMTYFILCFPLMTASILFCTLFFFLFTFSVMYLRNIWFPTWGTNTSVFRWNKNSLKPADPVTVEMWLFSESPVPWHWWSRKLTDDQVTWLVQNSAVSWRLWRWLTDPQRTLLQDLLPRCLTKHLGVCFSFGYF